MRVGIVNRSAFSIAAHVALLLSSTAFVAVPIATPALAQTAQGVSYNIPAGKLSTALTRWAQASGIKLLAPADALKDRSTAGLSGSHTPQDALATLLGGTGLTYTFSGSTVTISAPNAGGNSGAAEVPGAIPLDTIDVSGGGSAAAAADVPYQTPGSSNYISGEEIQRFRGETAGDMFKATPGVISGMNRNGAAVDVNIRGLQGQNRVAVRVDGSEQSTSSYRAYQGVDNRSYVDPDLIGGVTIAKGPDGGSSGAIGGTVSMETLNASDILKPGETYGGRVKGSLGTNGTDPVIGATDWSNGGTDDVGGSKSFSGALAIAQENIDVVAAFVTRERGNYFAGTNGALETTNYRGGTRALSKYKYGDEVFNTSEDSLSALFKAAIRPAEGHELKLSYLRHENDYGEVLTYLVDSNPVGVFKPEQQPLSTVVIDQFSARYNWKPVGNDLVDFRVNSWMSYTDEVTSSTIPAKARNYGVELSNTSRFETGAGKLAFNYGASAKLEDAMSDRRISLKNEIGVDGEREIQTAFARATWEPVSWLALDAGATYLTYHVENRTTLPFSYTGLPYEAYDGDGVSPSFGVTVTPFHGWQLFATYAEGIRPPSLRESTWNASKLQFNPNLVAETAKNWEFGTNYLADGILLAGDKVRLKLAYFDNHTEDYIGRENLLPGGGVLRMFNYDYVDINGVELSGGYDAKRGFVDFAFNYYTDLEFCKVGGVCSNGTFQSDYIANQIPPEFSAAVTVGARFFDEKLTVGGRVTYMGARAAPVQEDNYSGTLGILTKSWEPYTLVDLFAQWKVDGNHTFDLSAENITDRYYVDALANTDQPAPGRVIRASLTASLGGSGPILPEFFGDVGEPADWTGPYVGVHVGHGFASIEGETTAADGTPTANAAAESADMDLKNMLGGFQAGYNYQLGNGVVVGVEGDFAWTALNDFSETISTEGQLLMDRKYLQAKTDYKIDWLSTLRGRLGFTYDRALFYGTGGLAFLKERRTRTQFQSTSASPSNPAGSQTNPLFDESADATRTGVALGFGAELKLNSHWTLKGEYQYAGFGDEDLLFPDARAGVTRDYNVTTICRPNSPPPCPGGKTVVLTEKHPGSSSTVNGRKASDELDLHSLRVGLNYRF